MAHSNTIMSQVTKIVPRHEFETLAKKHYTGRAFRTFSRWNQFVAMTAAQLSSLRDLTANMNAQLKKLYHLGVSSVSRTTLACVNDEKPYTLYEALFAKLLRGCRSYAPKHKFKFKNKLTPLMQR